MDVDVISIFENTLKTKFNFHLSLKEEQIEIVQSILKKKDASVILPTGYGKSMCYILPPLILDQIHHDIRHISLVVSPLISLMEDQRTDLAAHGITAKCVSRDMNKADLTEVYKTDASVIFTSPEALKLPHWRTLLLRTEFRRRLCVIACDEAHCISEWGESFRPDYREISQLRSFVDCPVVALTATATDRVQKDIFQYLLLDETNVLRVSRVPNRPNIFLGIKHGCKHEVETELSWIPELLKSTGTGPVKKTIIFCRSYTATYNVWSWLMQVSGAAAYSGEVRARNRTIEMFHASTDADTKSHILSEFKKENGVIRILVSTIAFGMGVQIPDIEYVIHWGAPKSVLNYYQEVGRGGRDGRAATAVMYPVKRSLMKTVTDEEMREVVSQNECIRQAILEKLITESMNRKEIPIATLCGNMMCATCECGMCKCCSLCKTRCKCPGNKNMLYTVDSNPPNPSPL